MGYVEIVRMDTLLDIRRNMPNIFIDNLICIISLLFIRMLLVKTY